MRSTKPISTYDLVVLEHYGRRAGGQVVADQLATFASELGASALIAAPDGPWPSDGVAYDVSRISVRLRHSIGDLAKLRRFIGSDTLVVLNGIRASHLLLALRFLRPRARFLIYVHNVPSRSKVASLQRLLLRFMGLCVHDRVVVASYMRRWLSGHATVLHNASRDSMSLAWEDVSSRFDSSGARTIKFMGRDDPVKGLPFLVAALRRLTADMTVPFVAEFALSEGIHGEQTSTALDLESVGRSVGAREADWFKPGDIVCVPSVFESSPLVVVEALARGAVVASTNVGGVAELLSPDYPVPPVSYGQVDDLAVAILQLLTMSDSEFEDVVRLGWARANKLAVEWRLFWEAQIGRK